MIGLETRLQTSPDLQVKHRSRHLNHGVKLDASWQVW